MSRLAKVDTVYEQLRAVNTVSSAAKVLVSNVLSITADDIPKVDFSRGRVDSGMILRLDPSSSDDPCRLDASLWSRRLRRLVS
jgi:hypothetical protein